MIGFAEIGLVFIVAAVLAYIARFINQPMIPAYIISGILITPVLGLVTDTNIIAMISQIGVIFLLFIVGLEIDIQKIREVGKYVVIGSIVQVVLTVFATYFVFSYLGFNSVTSVYLGFIAAFSSTMVVVKLMSDFGELETIHARLVIGFLLMQDIIAVFALSSLGSIAQFSISTLAWAILKGFFVIILAILLGKYILPRIFKFAAKSQELLFISAIAACFLFAIMFTSMTPAINFLEKIFSITLPETLHDLFNPGLGFTIGAFFAGVILGNLPYNFGIISKVKSVKDFFSIMFYVSLGMQVVFSGIASVIAPTIILFLIVIILKPLIILLICSLFGFKKRTSLFSALYMSQVSEFSLIIAFQGMSHGHIDNGVLTMSVIVMILSIASTSYYFQYAEKINRKLRWLNFLEMLSRDNREPSHYEKKKYNIILCGYNRIGYSILKSAAKQDKSILIVDYNPEVIRKLMAQKIPCVYGDIEDEQLLDEIKISDAELVISTVPEVAANILLIKKAKANGNGIVFVTANQIEEAIRLYEAGADYVILPHFLGGEHVSLILDHIASDYSRIHNIRHHHINELHYRRGLGHEHPEHSSR